MFCSKCGVKLPDDSNFCAGCGYKIINTSNNNTYYDNKETNSETFKDYVIGTIIAVVMMIIIFGIITNKSSRNPKSTTRNQSPTYTAANFVGTWDGVDEGSGLSTVYTFNRDGTVQSVSIGITNRGTYRVSGNTIQITMTEGFTGILFPDGQSVRYNFRFNGNDRLQLTTTILGIRLTENLIRR